MLSHFLLHSSRWSTIEGAPTGTIGLKSSPDSSSTWLRQISLLPFVAEYGPTHAREKSSSHYMTVHLHIRRSRRWALRPIKSQRVHISHFFTVNCPPRQWKYSVSCTKVHKESGTGSVFPEYIALFFLHYSLNNLYVKAPVDAWTSYPDDLCATALFPVKKALFPRKCLKNGVCWSTDIKHITFPVLQMALHLLLICNLTDLCKSDLSKLWKNSQDRSSLLASCSHAF